ncbi:hypothetical protein ACFUN7_06540 [Streptomyces sp. NPDC057236]|uniref:hypothetical protein n=1 Tax=Streptomyces sp. NPDC057236 TaxID=3346059 RepID=UPI003631229C
MFTVFSRCPLRQVVRVPVCSPHSASIFALASVSISSCKQPLGDLPDRFETIRRTW